MTTQITMKSRLAALAAASSLFVAVVAHTEALTKMPYDEALACVRKVIPSTTYATNDLLPTKESLSAIQPLAEKVKLRVGMPWVLNDEQAPFYNAVANGYFADEGLDVELVPGGPGNDHLQTLAGGSVDVAVIAQGSVIPQALTSPTAIKDIVAVGAILKGAPGVLLTIKPELQGKKLTPADLEGRVVSASNPTYIPLMLDRAGVPVDSVTLTRGGFTPDVLYAGQADFFFGWIFNQTRDIEAKGYKWNGMMFRDFGFDNYTDVIVMKRDALDDPQKQDIAKRFLRATYRGLDFLLRNPEKSAEITVKMSTDAPNLTKEQAMFRFTRQEFLVRGDKNADLLAMNADLWDENTAILLQYGFMPNVSCK